MSSTSQIVWSLEQNAETNDTYKAIRADLQRIVRQAHQLLYNNGAVVGMKAQNDIMRILTLVILSPYFHDETGKLFDIIKKVKQDRYIDDEDYNRYINYCMFPKRIALQDDSLEEWNDLVSNFLTHIYPDVFTPEDAKFNCSNDNTIKDIINIMTSIDINGGFIDAFSTTCGDIHESFRAYGGGKGAKELGQYFTPRQLIHLIFHGLGLQEMIADMENVSIYDCCMGTGGFLTRMYNLTDVKPENVYGCETEQDTIKFGSASMLLTTKSPHTNIVKCDSLCENPFLLTKKMNVIVTNPPFGTKMKYKELQKKFEDKFPNSHVTFNEIYPIEVNNGACLFVQHCVYMLEEGGVCAIVLPDGELFDGNGKWPKAFRKWWCETVNIVKILKVPSGTFEHAGVKTNVVVFTKTGPTQEIRYLQTIKSCEFITNHVVVSVDEMEKNDFTMDVKQYEKVNITSNSNVQTLEQVCEFKNGKALKKSEFIDGPYLVIGGGQKPIGNHSSFNCEENTILCSSSGSAGYISRYEQKVWATDCFSIKSKDQNILNESYLYLFLKYHQNEIYNLQTGAGQPHVYSRDLCNMLVNILPINLQQKIVEELTCIEQSINTIKTRIEQLTKEKELYTKYGRVSEIREILIDSNSKQLYEVCTFEKGKIASSDIKENGDYPVISKAKHSTSWKKTDTYTNDGCNLYIGDTFAGDGKGDISIHYFEGKCSHTNLVLKCILCDDLVAKYLYYMLLDNIKVFNEKYQKGSSKPVLDKEKFKTYLVQIPSIEDQNKCIIIYDEKYAYLRNFTSKIEKEKQYIDELKQLGRDIIISYCS